MKRSEMAVQYGYAGKILKVDLSSGSTTDLPTADYADRFLGGRGIAAKIYWDEVSPQTGALDPENRLLFMTGPLAGFSGIAGSRWTVCGKSPATNPEHFSYTNMGGSWGAQLKFAGYDGIVIKGESDRPIYLSIQDGVAEIRDASTLWRQSTVQARETLKTELGSSTRVVACGPAGENMVTFAGLIADNDASGSNGFGAVMGAKKLKAIAVRGSKRATAANPEKLEELRRYVRGLKTGFSTLHDERPTTDTEMKLDPCYGCIGGSGCIRATRATEDGTRHKFFCGSAVYYHEWAVRHYGEVNEVPFLATVLCDGYGLDVYAVHTMIAWLSRCYKAGILDDESIGIPISKLGSLEFIETLLRKITFREGFGEILAQGLVKAADSVGKGSQELITDYVSKAGRISAYCPRMYIVSGLLYAMEPTLPMHQLHEVGIALFDWLNWANKVEGSYLSSEAFRKIARRFWGGELAADFSTYDGKALATTKIQDRAYAKESLILCDVLWPITQVRHSEDHVGDPGVESKLLSAVTGREVDEQGLYRIGERVFNLQRAILVREGHRGREDDVLPEPFYTKPLKFGTLNPECLAPGKNGEVISRKGAVVERERFEGMKDEYYPLRGWDVVTGLQTRTKLEELGLAEVADDLEKRKLLAVP